MKIVFSAMALLVLAGWSGSAGPADDVKITPDVVYGHKFGMALTFDVYQPKENANGAGVLFMVSGGWYSRWRDPARMSGIYQGLVEKGFTVFSVRHGSSPKFNIPEVVGDVRRSVRFIRQEAKTFGVDPERLGVCGGSAGGHLSLVLGTASDAGDPKSKDRVLKNSSRVAAVVAYYPPTDIRPWVKEESFYFQNYPALRIGEDEADGFSPILHVSPDDPPTLLIHGDLDKLVPIDHSEKILVKFKEKNVTAELLVIKGAAHGFRGDDGTRASAALVAWFGKHLR
jgi:acetyl esterase/lipase